MKYGGGPPPPPRDTDTVMLADPCQTLIADSESSPAWPSRLHWGGSFTKLKSEQVGLQLSLCLQVDSVCSKRLSSSNDPLTISHLHKSLLRPLDGPVKGMEQMLPLPHVHARAAWASTMLLIGCCKPFFCSCLTFTSLSFPLALRFGD